MATSFWEDTNAATVLEPIKHGLINLTLINMRCDLELGTLVAVLDSLDLLVLELAIVIDVVASGELLQGELGVEGALDAHLLGPIDFGNLDVGAAGSLDGGEEDHAAHLTLLLEVGADATDEGRVVDGVGKIDGALARLGRILGSADGDGADLARGPADEALDGLLRNEEGDAAFSLISQGAL